MLHRRGQLPDMSAAASEESELIEKHEEILERRAELLEQMEARRDQLILQRRRRLEEAEDARLRNASLLQDLQRMEDGLRGNQLPCSQVQALETRYWASVEESVPAWENLLLGKGSHSTDGPGRPARRTRQRGSSKQEGLPPRPRPRAPQ